MPIWDTQPPSRQPELTLKQWRVKQLPDGDRHLMGYCLENGEGRVSSRIVRLDCGSRIVETGSGRIYQLQGPPGNHMDAEYVWNFWLRANGLSKAKDVTSETYNAIIAAARQTGAE